MSNKLEDTLTLFKKKDIKQNNCILPINTKNSAFCYSINFTFYLSSIFVKGNYIIPYINIFKSTYLILKSKSFYNRKNEKDTF